MKLDFYADADVLGLWKHEDDQDPVCVKSTTGYVMNIGGFPFNWLSNIQKEISLQNLEYEYIALYQAMRYLIPLSQFIQEVGTQLNMEFAYPVIMNSILFEDNNGAMGLDTSNRKTTRVRHIAVKYHLFREHVGEGKGIMIQRAEYKDQKADVFNKVLPEETYKYIRKLLAGW